MSNQKCNHHSSTNSLPPGKAPRRCGRDIWKKDKCIWHSKIERKPIDQIHSALRVESDRIDEPYLHKIESKSSLDFSDLCLYGADFTGSSLGQCDFRNSKLRNSSFTDANLKHTKFQGEYTDLRKVDFQNTDLEGAIFNKAELYNADFMEAKALSAHFIDTKLVAANFTQADVREADFSGANLRESELIATDLYNSKLNYSSLKEAELTRADLREAELYNVQMDQTYLRDVRVDSDTKFDDFLLHEYASDVAVENSSILPWIPLSDFSISNFSNDDKVVHHYGKERRKRSRYEKLTTGLKRLVLRVMGKVPTGTPKELENARYRYRDLQRVYTQNSEPEIARKYAVREKTAARKQAATEDRSKWMWLSFYRHTMKYGEDPIQALKTAGMVFLVSTLLYPYFGVQRLNTGEEIYYCWDCSFSWNGIVDVIRLSITRLLTPSYPGLKPLGMGEAVALLQSLLGALLIAMFVFVLGRRATE